MDKITIDGFSKPILIQLIKNKWVVVEKIELPNIDSPKLESEIFTSTNIVNMWVNKNGSL